MSTQELVRYQPRATRTDDQLRLVRLRMDADLEQRIGAKIVRDGGVVRPIRSALRLIPRSQLHPFAQKSVRSRILGARKANEETAKFAKIIAVIPAYEKEDEIHKSVESLLLQTRPADLIVVVINGAGESDIAHQQLLPLIAEFPEQLKVEVPSLLNGRHGDGKSKGGKVRALNYAYERYIFNGDFDFMLGMDADVEADEAMVHHLEVDLLKKAKAGGVMARYSFKIPKHGEMKGRSLSLIHGQRHEFTATGIKHQLRGDTSEILGGQATLFRVEALKQAARVTDGVVPWDSESLVEDAQLTRTLESLGWSPATSRKARAWTGLMFDGHSWRKQRIKWQDGHLTDMMRDFHPWLDRRRWREQMALGWNLLLRVLFAVVLAASIFLEQFVFHLAWLAPVGLAILQSVLIALKVPDRTFREVVRAFLFIPGEIYYVRTLSVWLDSVMLSIINIRRDGWSNQALAESARKRVSLTGWFVIVSAVAVPVALFWGLSTVLPADVMSNIITYCWYTVTILTIGSVLGMVWFILRMIRNFRTLAP